MTSRQQPTEFLLETPLNLFEDFPHLPLPDAIASLLFRIAEKDRPSGIELFAQQELGAIELARLRKIASTTSLTLARIEGGGYFYINVDRSELAEEDVAFLYGVEMILNRIARVLDSFATSDGPIHISPAVAGCYEYDQNALASVGSVARELINHAGDANPWRCPGSVTCTPGGEWDIRTRMASACERMNLIARLEYRFSYDARTRTIYVSFIPPTQDGMPRAEANGIPAMKAWELRTRMVLALLGAGFSAGFSIERCVVCASAFAGMQAMAWDVSRGAFFVKVLPVADALNLDDPTEVDVDRALAPYFVGNPTPLAPEPDPRYAMPRDDDRVLPPELRGLFLADTARELEIMEDPDEPHMQRVAELRELAETDRGRAAAGFVEVIEELQASCAAAELLAETPLISQYCERYTSRLLLGLNAEDRSLRIHRAPDALYNAQFYLAQMYMAAGMHEEALPELRKLLDMASTSVATHYALISALAHLQRWEELADVAKRALTFVSDPDEASYLLYRLAFAEWQLGQTELALACYRLVPPGYSISDAAQSEMHDLMAELRRTEVPALEPAVKTAQGSNIPLPPHDELCEFIANATVQLADNGFFFLARHLVIEMWRTMRRDELGVVHRSFEEWGPEG